MAPEVPIASPRRTKLRPPRLADDLIARPQLLERLDRLAALSLVVAPAGYGKTTLVSMWLAHTDLPSAWVSLDEEDNDPSIFLADVVTALRTLFPAFGGAIAAQLDSLRERPFVDLVTAVINELNLLDREFVLVLDDYHWVHDPAIHQLLIQLLTHPPRAIHLVLTARHDPPLPWHLRTRGYLCEIRARDLSFTQAETAEFLAKAADRPIDAGTARELTEQAEGWVTSLRLAALNVRRQAASYAWPTTLNGSQRNLVEYFASEVMAYLSQPACHFLIQTAILDTLNGALCDFVVGDTPGESGGASRGAALLQQLEADGIFVSALDEDGTWYRLHPSFKHALQHKLQESCTTSEIARLYARAVIWHEQHGLLDEAIHYALAGQQVESAVGVVRRHRQQLLDATDFRRLERWLRQFPPATIGQHADLLLIKAWLLHIRFETPDERACLEQVATLLAGAGERTVQESEGEAEALRSLIYVCSGEAQKAILSGQRALELMPRSGYQARGVALLSYAFGSHMAGETSFVDSLLDDAAADPCIARDLASMRSHQVRHFVQLMAANLFAMRAAFPKLLQMALARDFKTTVAWAHYFWGCAGYLQNDLGEANEHFCAVLELVDCANAAAYTQSVIGLALTRQAQGAPHEAAAVVESAQVYLRQVQLYQMEQVLNAFAAELAARQGRSEDALRWLTRAAHDLVVDATPMFYVPGLAPVKVLIAAGGKDSLAAAQTWLTRVGEIAVRTRNTHAEIQTLTLQATLSEAQGNRAHAIPALSRALALAEKAMIVRVFADLSRQLAPLLAALEADSVGTEFLVQVRSAVESDLEIMRKADPAVAPVGTRTQAWNHGAPDFTTNPGHPALQAATSRPAGRDLHLLLTFREMDVLRLLDQRLTNKEIARHLGISTETVRQHTVKLFRKLNVKNRRQAIVVARALGYLAN